MMYLIWMAGIFLMDLLCKEYVLKHREKGEEIRIFKDRVILRNVRNYGFAMNCLDRFPTVIRTAAAAVNTAAAMVFAFLLTRPGRKLEKAGLACIVGGGLSNLYDRIHRGYVVDYVSFQSPWKRLTDLVFNIGDFFIIGGSILFSIGRIFHLKK